MICMFSECFRAFALIVTLRANSPFFVLTRETFFFRTMALDE